MKVWLLAVLALLIIPTAFAIGISPTSMEIPLADNDSKTAKFYVVNTEDHPVFVELYSHGAIADYVSLDISEITLGPNEVKPFTAEFELPGNLTAGTYKLIIGAKSSGKSPTGTGMSTAIAAEALVYLKKLFGSGVIGLEITVSNTSSADVPVVFNLKVNEQPPDLTAKAQIINPQGKQIGNVTFPAFVNGSSKASWTAPAIGSYRISATASWPKDGSESKGASFSVGKPYIDIQNISILQQNAIYIVTVDTKVQSYWNDALNVWAEGTVYSGAGKISNERSNEILLGANGNNHLRLYFNEKEDISKYDLEITLHYAGLTTTKRVPAESYLTEKLSPAKNSLTGAFAALFEVLEPIHIAIIILLAILLALVYIYLREPKPPEPQPYQQPNNYPPNYYQGYYNQYYDPYGYYPR